MALSSLRIFVAGLSALMSLQAASRGEVFLLANGGRVEGELLNPQEIPRKTYVIKTALGGQITLAPSQVTDTVRQRPEEIEYEQIRAGYPDTVEGQWALAEWCNQRTLLSQRKKHLQRIIDLDPDNAQARLALGYNRIDGRWMTQEERMLSQGYRRYRGQWRLQQEIDLLEQQEKLSAAEGQWKQKLKQWRQWLGTERSRTARENILQIRDPAAVKALALALQEDPRDQARLLYVEALARIGTPGAMQVLAIQAMDDRVEEVRLTCLDRLKEKKNPRAVEYFVRQLHDEDNGRINRAARALRQMGDSTAVPALIDTLVTTHKIKIASRNPGQMNTSFDNRGGGGLSVGGGGPTVVSVVMNNRDVLDALATLSGGANFGFDVGRWKSWLTSHQARPELDARRD